MEKDMLSIISNRKIKIFGRENSRDNFSWLCCYVYHCCCLYYRLYDYFWYTSYFQSGNTRYSFLGTVWAPTAADPQFGILLIILTSIIGVFLAICIGVPIGLFTAINLAELANPKVRKIVKSAIELLAGIPSVVYGLLGILIICPFMYRLELLIFAGSKTHQFTGGANLISAILVLAIMILPTLINITETALKAVPDDYRKSSLALGASQMQTIF